jgi:hypothetical protein
MANNSTGVRSNGVCKAADIFLQIDPILRRNNHKLAGGRSHLIEDGIDADKT